MNNAIHFISGLPRAGSTLLSALLKQNPKFRAGMTGPVGTLVEAMQRAMSMSNETSVFIDDTQREALLRKIFETFHGDLPADHVSFDTNRMWCAKLALLAQLFPEARVICCVRDVASIVNSIERLVLENTLQPSGIFGFEPGGTVYSRAEGLGNGNGMVGFAYNALRQAFYGPHSSRLLLVTYETLTRDPQRALSEVYRFLGKPAFKHDFKNIVFDADEFDRRLGTPNLHVVGREVRVNTAKNLLPPDLLQKYAGDNFWRDPAANFNKVPVV
jgi:sulfotransferase